MKSWLLLAFGLVIASLLTVIVVLVLRLNTADYSTTTTSTAPVETALIATTTTRPPTTSTTTTTALPPTSTTTPQTTTTQIPTTTTTTTRPPTTTTTTTTSPQAVLSRASAGDASPGSQQLFCRDVQAAIAVIIKRQIGVQVTIPCHGYLDVAEELICPGLVGLDAGRSVEVMAAFLTMWAESELDWPEGMEPTDQEIALLMETWVQAAGQYLCPIIN